MISVNFFFKLNTLSSFAFLQIVMFLLFQPLYSQQTNSSIGYESTERALQDLHDLLTVSGEVPGIWPDLFFESNSTPCSNPKKKWSGIDFESSGGRCELIGLEMNYYLFKGLKTNLPIERVINVTLNFEKLRRLVLADFFSGSIPPFTPGALSSLTSFQVSSNRQVTGTIPPSLMILKKLQYLNILNNSICGSVPEQLGDLTDLKKLNLNGNALTGTIPISLGNLAALTSLALYNNSLSGSISSQLSLISNLFTLHLYNNRFSGTIPSGLGNLGSLRIINLAHNKLSGSIPDEFGLLTKLQLLSLDFNELTGTLPGSLGRIPGLKLIEVSNNLLTGYLPVELGKLSNLSKLYFSSNMFSGTIPSEYSGMLELSELSLDGNSLSGSLPDQLRRLSKLTRLIVSANSLVGSIPNIFEGMTRLFDLHLHLNAFSGSLPPSMLALNKLKLLYLWENKLSGSLSTEKLCSLEQLKVQSNQFVGKFPQFCNSSKIAELILFNNRFTGPILLDLGDSRYLKYIEAGSNLLTGPLPSSLFDLKNLVRFDVSNNRISSTIPKAIGRLQNATHIQLGKNSITGTIPTQIGALVNLQVLDVRTCILDGTLPTQFGLMSSLQVLNASKNAFSGKLPDELGNLRNLLQLSLHSNELTGPLPSSLSKLASIEQVYLYDNSLTGSAEIFFTNGSFPSLKYLDLSTNLFSGSLVIQSAPPKLKFVSMMINCLSGSLEIGQLCQAPGLEMIMFDGITSRLRCNTHNYLWGEQGGKVTKANFEKYFGSGLQWQFNSYRREYLHGSLPGCIFVLPNITSVHFTGIGLVGSLPQEYESWSPRLRDVSIAYNRLGDKIPPALLQAASHLKVLDLRSNNFKGSLDGLIVPTFTNDTTFNLQLNRFSGKLPLSVLSFEGTLDILEGNLFECKSSDMLPAADHSSAFYSCGSDQFNYTLYAALGALFLTVAFVGYQITRGRFNRLVKLIQMSSRLPVRVFRAISSLDNTNPILNSKTSSPIMPTVEAAHTEAFIVLLSKFSSLSGFLGFNLVVILMILYASLKLVDGGNFSMYQEQYTWTLAAIFLTGATPAGVLVAVWSLFLIFPLIWFYRSFHARLTAQENSKLRRSALELLSMSVQLEHVHKRNSERPRSSRNPMISRDDWPRESLPTSSFIYAVPKEESSVYLFFKNLTKKSGGLCRFSVTLRLGLRMLIICIINCSVALVVNVSYVYLYLFGDITRKNQVMLQIGVAGVKLALRHLAPVLSRSRALRLGLSKGEVDSAPAYLKTDEGTELLLTLFSSIVAPLVATAATDQTCFYNVIKGNNEILTTVSYPSVSLKREEISSYNLTTSSAVELSKSFSQRSFEFLPPFVYSYECTSSLIRVYAPPLLLVGLLKTFLFPFAAYFGRVALYFCHRRKSQYDSKTFPADSDADSGGAGQPSRDESGDAKEDASRTSPEDQKIRPGVMDSAAVKSALHAGGRKMLDMVMICLIAMTPKLLQQPSERKMYEEYVASNIMVTRSFLGQLEKYVLRAEADREVVFVDAKRIILDAIIDLLVLLTFGVVCPLLALVYILAIYCRCTRWIYMIATFVSREDTEAKILLNLDCARAWKRQKNLIFRLRWLIVMFPSIFLSFFILDVAASSQGLTATYWIPIAMICIPSMLSMTLRKAFPSLFNIPRLSMRKDEGESRQANPNPQESQADEGPHSSVAPVGIELIDVIPARV